MQSRSFDAIVLGGGPAGSAAAITLLEAGKSVALVEATVYEKPRIGETLPPDVRIPLAALNALDDLANHLPSSGNAVVWEAGDFRWNDFMFHPYGCGWHVDRRVFDYSLARRAERRGAVLMMPCRATDCQYSKGIWRVTCSGVVTKVSSRWLICATGRGASPLRQRMGRPMRHDYLLASYCRGELGSEWAFGNRTVIEAVEDGWWYSAPLPNRLAIFVFFSSPWYPLNFKHWQCAMNQASMTRERFNVTRLTPKGIAVAAAPSWHSPIIGGEGWIACGDAAITRDPLSSQGILNALTSGISAARTFLGGQSPEDYSKDIKEGYLQYLRYRQSFYDQVKRFSTKRFWIERRCASRLDVTNNVTQATEAKMCELEIS